MRIGIDLGGMSAKAAIIKDGKLVGKCTVKTDASEGFEATASKLAELTKNVCKTAGVNYEEITGIGVGAPGVIDGKNGVVVRWSNYNWENVPLGKELARLTGKPVRISNDANCAALGEAKFGAGKSYSDSVMLTLGTGVGGGVVIDGKLFEGFKGAGVELGHVAIKSGGKRCSCGREGCLEAYTSTRALVERTREAMEKDTASALWNGVSNLSEVDGKTLFSALDKDRCADEVYAEYIADLGEGVVNFVNIFRPQVVVIGGGISAEGERLLAPLREYVMPRIYVSAKYVPLAIVCATLGNDAGIFGAGELLAEG